MPIYEYRCEGCGERFEEFLSHLDEARAAVPEVRRRRRPSGCISKINTEWLPSDVAWDRVGRSWD